MRTDTTAALARVLAKRVQPDDTMLPSTTRDPRDPAVIRVERELARLEKLAASKRLRIAVMRGLRGLFGAGGTLAALLKLKLAGSLGLKIGLAVVVGLGFAWPLYALAALLIGFAILSILSLEAPSCDCPCDCQRKESRRARLDRMIEARRTWLRGRDPLAAPRPASVGAAR